MEVLDVCCGSRMFYFDKDDSRVLFCDKRFFSTTLKDKTAKGGIRQLSVEPDMVCDFTELPFKDETFPLVVFDPPHLEKIGDSGWLAQKYGKLKGDWRSEIERGFSECFRVLKNEGTLIFKWNETDIPVSEIIKLAKEKPLFGNRSGKQSKTHWIVFQKNSRGL
jgi:ubiquinone/menaquinone biosynthesis C-methylase UbiE